MTILITHPDFSDPGGVAAYYRKLKGKFSLGVDHFFIGRRPGEDGTFGHMRRMIKDTMRFGWKMLGKKVDIVHLNPSLDPKSLIRDGILMLLVRLSQKKVVVFFRGWQKQCQYKVRARWLWLFNMVFGQADAFIVLSKEYEHVLRSWGYRKPIFCETTIIDDDALFDFNMEATLAERMKSEKYYILFISRLAGDKGLYEVIEAVRLLSEKISGVELIVAGDGPELGAAKEFASAKNVNNINFTGYVTGDVKKRILQKAHLLCYPTNYGEGMPNTLVESMGFGLPVVTRSVGGVADFFKNSVHGFITVEKEPQVFSNMMEKILKNEQLYRTISMNNYTYSQSHFKASLAAKRLENIYESLSLSQ